MNNKKIIYDLIVEVSDDQKHDCLSKHFPIELKGVLLNEDRFSNKDHPANPLQLTKYVLVKESLLVGNNILYIRIPSFLWDVLGSREEALNREIEYRNNSIDRIRNASFLDRLKFLFTKKI